MTPQSRGKTAKTAVFRHHWQAWQVVRSIAAVRQRPRTPRNWRCSFTFFESFLWHFNEKQRREVIFRHSRPVSCKNQENGAGKQWSVHAPLKNLRSKMTKIASRGPALTVQNTRGRERTDFPQGRLNLRHYGLDNFVGYLWRTSFSWSHLWLFYGSALFFKLPCTFPLVNSYKNLPKLLCLLYGARHHNWPLFVISTISLSDVAQRQFRYRCKAGNECYPVPIIWTACACDILLLNYAWNNADWLTGD